MSDVLEAVWLKPLARLRWAMTIASLAYLLPTLTLLRRHRADVEPRYNVYLTSLVLFLAIGAVFCAWTRRWTGFVLLALAGQMASAYVALFDLLLDLAVLPAAKAGTIGLMLPHTIWNMAVFCFAIVVAYFTLPCIFATASAPWPKDLRLLRALLVATMIVAAGQAGHRFLVDSRHLGLDFDIYHKGVVLLLLGGACVAGWKHQQRKFILLAVASHLLGGFMALYLLLLELFLEASGRSLPRMSWNVVVACFGFAIAAYLTLRHMAVRVLSPPREGAGEIDAPG